MANTPVPNSNQHQFHQERVLQIFDPSLLVIDRLALFHCIPVRDHRQTRLLQLNEADRTGTSGAIVFAKPGRTTSCAWQTKQQAVPTKANKLSLLAAGLGCKKITFGNKDDAPIFKGKVENASPKLKHGGGFDLLRSGARPGELLVI